MTPAQASFLPRKFLSEWNYKQGYWSGKLAESWPDGFQIRDAAGSIDRW